MTVSDISLGNSAPGLVVWSAGKFAAKGVLNGSIDGPSIAFEIKSGRYHFCAVVEELKWPNQVFPMILITHS